MKKFAKYIKFLAEMENVFQATVFGSKLNRPCFILHVFRFGLKINPIGAIYVIALLIVNFTSLFVFSKRVLCNIIVC